VTPETNVELGGTGCVDELRSLWLALHRHERTVAPTLPFVPDDLSWRRRRSLYIRWLELEQGFLAPARNGAGVVGYAFVRLDEGFDDTFALGSPLVESAT
jgi:hypothetical protein